MRPSHPYVWVVRVSVHAREEGKRQETALRRLPVVVRLWCPKNLALLVVLSRECMQIGGMQS